VADTPHSQMRYEIQGVLQGENTRQGSVKCVVHSSWFVVRNKKNSVSETGSALRYVFKRKNCGGKKQFYYLKASACGGMASHVRPSSDRPFFFLFTPPHCLKKKATF
jgi:hypothetical protein